MYEGTSFNEKVVLSMTKKQFQLVGGTGNKLTQAQLAEAYDLISSANTEKSSYANDTKLSSGSGETKLRVSNGDKSVGDKGGVPPGTEGSDVQRY